MTKKAAIFWNCSDWAYSELPPTKHSIGGFESLDRAITAAKAQWFTIDRVQATRGQLPEVRKEPDGNRVA